jgi:hypothetical protein
MGVAAPFRVVEIVVVWRLERRPRTGTTPGGRRQQK